MRETTRAIASKLSELSITASEIDNIGIFYTRNVLHILIFGKDSSKGDLFTINLPKFENQTDFYDFIEADIEDIETLGFSQIAISEDMVLFGAEYGTSFCPIYI